MEDLYEDMCDGACLCALVAFYSDQMNMQSMNSLLFGKRTIFVVIFVLF